MHVPRIVGIVAFLAIVSFANAETKGLVAALVLVALVSLVVQNPAGVKSLAMDPAAALAKVIHPPVTPRPVLPGHEGGPR